MKQIYEYDLLFNYDFLIPGLKATRSGIDIFFDFKAVTSKHLMIRGGDVYAMYDYTTGLWTTNRGRMITILDGILMDLYSRYQSDHEFMTCHPQLMSNTSTKQIDKWNHYVKKQMWDNYKALDQKVIFANTDVQLEDYATFRLPYALAEGSIENYKAMFEPLYSPEEFRKLEWATGAILSGASKRTQKMLVLFGGGGTGKSTWLDLQRDWIFSWKRDTGDQSLPGYDSSISVKDLCYGNSAFALETLQKGPLISVDDDAKLDRIDDNTRLNSIVSHATLPVNVKNKNIFNMRFNTFVCVGTNTAVQIPDAKSGLLRRIIDVVPTGYKHKYNVYLKYLRGMHYEIGAIAHHCLKVFNEMGEDYYESYEPVRMMAATNYFYDFIDYSYDWFRKNDCVTLSEVWKRYQEYVTTSGLKFSLNRLLVKNQLKDYFDIYKKEGRINDKHVYDYYSGFHYWKFGYEQKEEKQKEKGDEQHEEGTLEESWLRFDKEESLFDILCADCLAQNAGADEKPVRAWADVTTRLKDIDVHKVHYVKVPLNHIVIDFDLKDADGQKSFLLNWKAASQWTPTYAELSKGGAGIHLHYIYAGDVEALSRLFDKDIEIKVFTGGASLRRKLTRCNDIPVATISSGLPIKEVKKMVDWDGVQNERMLRKMIKKNLAKVYHANTKPSIDYIYDLLQDAYEKGIKYDVSDLEPKVIAFAAKSTNQAQYCLKRCTEMHFKSDEPSDNHDAFDGDDRLIFFDIEIFPNLFLLNWKFDGSDEIFGMINPSPEEVEAMFNYKLVGFNNRKYDNHILWARAMGFTIPELYNLSQKIIIEHTGFFGEAYNISYTDVYDFASAGNKKSLKKFEIELGIHHQELGLPWDQPVPEEKWGLVSEYCNNDVIATEAVFHHLKGDWIARKILAELSGLTVNDTTNQHSTKIVFGNDPNPQSQFVYTDLSTIFPGYKFEYSPEKKRYVSSYRGIDPKEGGRVMAEPGMYTNVAVLDVASMHPHSIKALNLFGDYYTARFVDIMEARILIKHGEFDKARKIMDGKLAPYLDDESQAGDLSNALKTVINSVYGLTSAKFPNKFKDERNIDNIVAKRGALFMIDLEFAVKDRGYQVAHIKTDSIKIQNATPEIIQFVMDFGKQYGYDFEHESTYEKMCLVNDAVYIAQYATPEKCERLYGYVPSKNAKAFKKDMIWDATGAQFAQPYVFKTLFSHEKLEFKDYTEVKATTSALYLDMNEDLPDVTLEEKQLDKLEKKWKKERSEKHVVNMETFRTTADPFVAEERDRLMAEIAKGHNYIFVGRVGCFVPVKRGGGLLLRVNGDSFAAATGTSGYRWLEAETVDVNDIGNIDTRYHTHLVDDAIEAMSQFGDVEWFLSDDISPDPAPDFMNIPIGSSEEVEFAS